MIDLSGGIEDAKDNSVQPHFFGDRDIGLHDFELAFGVAEASGTRPDHSMNRNSDPLTNRSDQLRTRRDSARSQIAAKFDTVRAPIFSRYRLINRLHANFNKDRICHALLA